MGGVLLSTWSYPSITEAQAPTISRTSSQPRLFNFILERLEWKQFDAPQSAYPHTVRTHNMGREEQIEEREVLDSIFPDEITGEISMPGPAAMRVR